MQSTHPSCPPLSLQRPRPCPGPAWSAPHIYQPRPASRVYSPLGFQSTAERMQSLRKAGGYVTARRGRGRREIERAFAVDDLFVVARENLCSATTGLWASADKCLNSLPGMWSSQGGQISALIGGDKKKTFTSSILLFQKKSTILPFILIRSVWCCLTITLQGKTGVSDWTETREPGCYVTGVELPLRTTVSSSLCYTDCAILRVKNSQSHSHNVNRMSSSHQWCPECI